jgi:hypothetical protein
LYADGIRDVPLSDKFSSPESSDPLVHCDSSFCFDRCSMVTGLGRCVIIFELVSVRGWGLVCNAWVRDVSCRLYCFVIGGCKFALAAQRLSDTLSGPLWLRFRVRDFLKNYKILFFFVEIFFRSIGFDQN